MSASCSVLLPRCAILRDVARLTVVASFQSRSFRRKKVERDRYKKWKIKSLGTKKVRGRMHQNASTPWVNLMVIVIKARLTRTNAAFRS